MTLYDDLEASVAGGRPVECYLFTGTQQTYAYTTNETSVIIGGNTYIPATIQRNEIGVGTQDDDGLDVTLTVPSDLDLVRAYAFGISPPDLDLVIYRFHRDDEPNNAIVYWNGHVSGFLWRGHVTDIRSPALFSSTLQTTIPPQGYQSACNNLLYDSNCKLVRTDFQFSTTVAIPGDRSLTLAEAPSFPDDSLVAGEVFLPDKNERRMIISNAGAFIEFVYPFSNLETGDNVQVVQGCDHSFETCRDKFHNSINFAGFHFVPNINPFIYGV